MALTIPILIIFNLTFGIIMGRLIARRITTLACMDKGNSNFVKIIVFIYFAECIAVALSMGTSAISIVLAFIWGVIGGRWLRKQVESSVLRRSVQIATTYTCVPVISLALIPLFCLIGGWDILSAEQGYSFGIPYFLHLPWPLTTILGFYMLMIIVSVLLKMIITLCVVRIINHARSNASSNIGD